MRACKKVSLGQRERGERGDCGGTRSESPLQRQGEECKRRRRGEPGGSDNATPTQPIV